MNDEYMGSLFSLFTYVYIKNFARIKTLKKYFSPEAGLTLELRQRLQKEGWKALEFHLIQSVKTPMKEDAEGPSFGH